MKRHAPRDERQKDDECENDGELPPSGITKRVVHEVPVHPRKRVKGRPEK
jgi:hypothetical protein